MSWLRWARRITGLLVVVATAACGDSGEDYAPTYGDSSVVAEDIYIFAVHPLHNPETLSAIYQPLLDHINARLDGPRLELEASRNYAAYEEKLAARSVHFALPNPYQTVTALEYGYRVFGKMGDDDRFRGIILVRRDSPIRTVADLKGKAVSYPAPTALAATMLPQAFLHQNGLDVRTDIENLYVGSQESSIMNVYLGHVAAGATWPPPWENFQKDEPDKAAALEVKWRTPALPNNGLIVRDDVPDALVAQVSGLLFSLHESPQGREILARMPLSRFEPADQGTYAPVRAFIAWFSATIRPPQQP